MTEPLTDQLVDGIHRIPLPLPLDDLEVINAYAFESSKGLILVDPGWATADTERILTAALKHLGYGLPDVTTMIATHGHWDHYTQAIAIRSKFGGRVLLGAGEHHSIDSFGTLTGCYPRQVELLRAAGAPDLADIIDVMPYQEHEKNIDLGSPDEWLHDGDTLDLGDRTLTIHGMPGHTRGHVVIADPDVGIMITGDHILPRITPSIGFEREPEAVPLRSFLSSLRATLELPDALMLPAHGPVSPSVHARARELLAHHDERLTVIREFGASGRSPHEIAQALPWTRHDRRLEDLNPVHQMVAILEVDAHLTYDATLRSTATNSTTRS
ncbi:MBL fold metallo-hydrolase [Rhodococcus opacus]|uniref:MBL fold metallo-hydrolase n=1 Tax=Rhodococcus opacus TaxID=37919 RepID=UPI000AC8DD98|nr:MBL fold metallo-hydrolase [Rhodococcus opacus]